MTPVEKKEPFKQIKNQFRNFGKTNYCLVHVHTKMMTLHFELGSEYFLCLLTGKQ